MSSTIDPMGAWKRRERLVLAGALVALAPCLAWALWPLPRAPEEDAEIVAPSAGPSGVGDRAPLNVAAFGASIWNPAPPPALAASGPEPAQKPLPAPRLQLIGITRHVVESGAHVLRAVLYDPDADELHVLATGERIGAFTVEEVAPSSVSIDLGGRVWRLALDGERKGVGK